MRSHRSLRQRLEAVLKEFSNSSELNELTCLKESLLEVSESGLEKLSNAPSTINTRQSAFTDIENLVLELVGDLKETQADPLNDVDSIFSELQRRNERSEQAVRV